MLSAWSRRLAARPGRILLLIFAVCILAGVLTSRLRLETDLVALLPSGSTAADDYQRFISAFGGFEKVFVIVDSPDPESNRGDLLAAAENLALALEGSSEIAAVRIGLEDEERDFFLRFVVRRALLFADTDSNNTAANSNTAVNSTTHNELAKRLEPAAIRQRVSRIRSVIHSPAGSAQIPLLTHDPLGFAEDLPLLGAGPSMPLDPLTSAFLSNDGQAALVVLTPRRAEIDPAGGRALAAELAQAYAEVEAEASVVLRWQAVGGPLYAAQDEAALRGDLEATITGSVIGCALLLVLAFESLLLPLAALASVAIALLWTAAALAISLPGLTAVAIGFAAVLVGLGMDYGIHGGARFRQLRLEGHSAVDALTGTFRQTGPGIATSALTTAAAFATLGMAHFRPLRELGIAVAIGIVAILLATVTLGATLLTRSGAPRQPGILWRLLQTANEVTSRVATRWPRTILTIAALLSLTAAWGLTDLELSPDLRAIRPTDHPALAAEATLASSFGLGSDTATVVIPGPDLDAVLDRCRQVEQLIAEHSDGAAQVTSPTSYLTSAPESAQRLTELATLPWGAAADELSAALTAANLAPGAFEAGLSALRALAEGRDPGAPTAKDWPAGLAELVRVDERDGSTLAALSLRTPSHLWPQGPPAELTAEIRRLAPGAAVASAQLLGGDLRDVASADLRTLLWAALAMVALVVGISFRGHFGRTLLALTPVSLGTLWCLGLWGLLGRDLDLLSLSVAPILLGIGIDDGLHAVHGAQSQSGPGALTRSVKEAGLAMTLTTLTTCVGFSSLTLSTIPGLRNGGLLISLGVFACLAASLLVLPAWDACGKKEVS